ncbi:MAG: ATP-dependent DNA helicase RecG [Marinilabiliaceae bacterium]|jgi:ATP-dependent DNA helicase RecG|nr:ATP-dependent DNA helicase RecG [Marinilabiliaceae bacterium]
MPGLLDTEITYLTGVGPKRAELLRKEAGIETFGDLLYYFPFKYIDRSKFHRISDLEPGSSYVQIKGVIDGFYTEGGGRTKRLAANFRDETGSIKLLWFKGIKWISDSYKINREYILFGKPGMFNGALNIIHPELEDPEKVEKRIGSGIMAQYSLTEKLRNSYISSKTFNIFLSNLFGQSSLRIPETLPSWMLEKYKLPALHDALFTMHFPSGNKDLEKARYRLKLEELFFIQLNLINYRKNRSLSVKGHTFKIVGDVFNKFYYNKLPYQLTGAQKRVIKEIRRDMGSGQQMNRLLQGDVGSGKTLVALMTMLIALDNGYQSCLMAPTEILAIQHFNTFISMLDGLGIEVRLLTGSSKKSERTEIAALLQDGRLNLLVGTHALIEETVQFKNLGMVVIDEQHRFGVEQRARLWTKSAIPPHVLVMTATPIPRTLAMTLYGDLDVSVIDEMPPGRKAVKTLHFTDSARLRVFGFMKEQIKEGRQVYIVYPLIKESEKLDYKNLEEGVEAISREFKAPEYTISVVHGQMTPRDKEYSMRMFKEGEAQILIATTVIEVGVDVSNASIMVIESSERFGLSQLHQLRGRVGRGASQSYCILMSSDKLSSEAQKRIEILVASNDGFEIAEADLRLRGPGDIEGTQQSGIGFNLKIANLGQDGQILEYARRIAEEIIEKDPELSSADNLLLKKAIEKEAKRDLDWGSIS